MRGVGGWPLVWVVAFHWRWWFGFYPVGRFMMWQRARGWWPCLTMTKQTTTRPTWPPSRPQTTLCWMTGCSGMCAAASRCTSLISSTSTSAECSTPMAWRSSSTQKLYPLREESWDWGHQASWPHQARFWGVFVGDLFLLLLKILSEKNSLSL